MTQQRVQKIGTKNIKKLLAELANRDVNWRVQKVRQIITTQRYGLNVSSSLRIGFPKNHKETLVVKSTNNSVKHIEVKKYSRLKNQLINSTDIDNNGNSQQLKRSVTHQNKQKISSFSKNKIVQDQNQAPKNQKQSLLPKLSMSLKKKTSLDFLKRDNMERQRQLDNQYLYNFVEKQMKSLKITQKDIS